MAHLQKPKRRKRLNQLPQKQHPLKRLRKKIKWLTWNEMVKLNEKNPKKYLSIFIPVGADGAK